MADELLLETKPDRIDVVLLVYLIFLCYDTIPSKGMLIQHDAKFVLTHLFKRLSNRHCYLDASVFCGFRSRLRVLLYAVEFFNDETVQSTLQVRTALISYYWFWSHIFCFVRLLRSVLDICVTECQSLRLL